MGISGLLPLLKSIHKPCSLKKFDGQTIGVDAYGWLHRGTAACAIELATDKPTTKFVDFAMNRVRMLIHFGVTPYIVFDGDYLPSKAGTEKERRAKRKEGKRLGLELLKMGKTSQAHLELQKSVDVTPEMARQFIEELKHHNIQYVVAPYEADSQLAYLERQGIIDGILSEDSDLLVFGAKCLITKLDKHGECVEINRNHFTACREISLTGWSDADFRRMAMLSGCDYLPGIGKMGLKTAYRMLRKHKTIDRLVKAAQFDGQFKVPAGFMEAFHQAEMTFLYQWVFCPQSNQIVNLTNPGPDVDVTSMPYIGAYVPSDIAVGVANGNLHPHTKEPIIIPASTRSRPKPMRPAPLVQSSVQTPDGKRVKPIDSFFKPRRTPLAELDPNIFTPSPSQQALLEQRRNSSWAAVPVPASQSRQRYAVPNTAPLPARRTISQSSAQHSVPNPAKRQRLCSDKYSDTPGRANDEGMRSRFFTSSLPEPSPSLRNTNKRQMKTRQDFELYSDDSFDEAIAEVADLADTMFRPKKKLAIFKDDMGLSVSSADSQSTAFSESTLDRSQDSAATITPGTSQGSPLHESNEESHFSAELSAQIIDLRSKFTYEASSTSGISVPTSLSAEHEPLTKLPQNLIPTSSTQDPVVSNASSKTKNNELEDSAWTTMEADVIVPNSSPVQPVPTVLETFQLRGSEDMFISDSEAESNSSPRKPTLNLARFAFCG